MTLARVVSRSLCLPHRHKAGCKLNSNPLTIQGGVGRLECAQFGRKRLRLDFEGFQFRTRRISPTSFAWLRCARSASIRRSSLSSIAATAMTPAKALPAPAGAAEDCAPAFRDQTFEHDREQRQMQFARERRGRHRFPRAGRPREREVCAAGSGCVRAAASAAAVREARASAARPEPRAEPCR